MKTATDRDEVISWLLSYAQQCVECGSEQDAAKLAAAVMVLRRHQDEEEDEAAE